MASLLSCRWLNRKEHSNRSTNNGDIAERYKRPYKLKILLLSKILFQKLLMATNFIKGLQYIYKYLDSKIEKEVLADDIFVYVLFNFYI